MATKVGRKLKLGKKNRRPRPVADNVIADLPKAKRKYVRRAKPRSAAGMVTITEAEYDLAVAMGISDGFNAGVKIGAAQGVLAKYAPKIGVEPARPRRKRKYVRRAR